MNKTINHIIYIFIYSITSICYANPANGNTYIIESALGDNSHFLNVIYGNPARGTQINTEVMNNTSAQKFTLINAGDGYFFIRSNTRENRMLAIANSHMGRNGTVILENRSNQNNLKWKFIPIQGEESFYNIQSRLGTYLGVTRNPETDKNFISTNPLSPQTSMKWKLNNISDPFIFKREFKINTIKNLCPTRLMKGDREFNGNGPNVTGRIFLAHDNKSVYALITFNAKETKSDWSEVRGEWIQNVFNSPNNWQINRILSDNNKLYYSKKITTPSSTYAISPGFGFHENSCVSRMWFTGDTGGNDISGDNNCSDDTGIRFIEFKPLILEFTYTP